MRHNHHHALLVVVLATGVALAGPPMGGAALAFDGNDTNVMTDPGFVPDTGQINIGFDKKVPTSTTESIKIPTPAEVRAAKSMPDSNQPALGQGLVELVPSATANATTSSGSSTTGSDSSAAAAPAPSGPIGATGQTMPTKFSKRNDILDRVPIMALPLPLTDQERQRIYQAVMADKAAAASDADNLVPASELSTNQALYETHPLPTSVRDIGAVKLLQYVKTKDKVLLVEPATRTVVDQIPS